MNRPIRESIAGPNYYRSLFAYNRRVWNRYFNASAKLSWKTLSKNMEISHYSMKNTLVHVLTVYNGWLNYNVYGRSSEIPHGTEHNPDKYNSMKQVREFSNKVWKGVDMLLDNLDDKLLSKKVKAPWLPGTYTLADVLMQVSFEQAHHIGEVIAMMWQLDIEPPEMTWIMNTR